MKVLIIGLGSIANKHITALQNINADTQFYALRSSENANIIDGVINVFSFLEVNTINFDFAIISNPTFAHHKTITNLIPLNIPLFIEKPLFSELDNGELVKLIHKHAVITYVACNLRFLDCLQYVKNYIVNKKINEVNIYCGSYLPDWRPGRDYKTTYSANKDQGGGVHIDLIHEIDYAYWLFGNPTEVSKVFSSKSSLEINAFDYANYTLGYSDFNTSIILNYFRRDPKRTLEIVLEEETLLVDILKNKVYRNTDIIFNSDKTIVDTYEDQLRFFIDNVVLGKSKLNSVDEAYQILEICLQNG
jgi:predicted dehydrogenase